MFDQPSADYWSNPGGDGAKARPSPNCPAAFLVRKRTANNGETAGNKKRRAKSLKGAAALWMVYPKGQKQLTENDVIAAGRKSGLKDVKVVGFSPTHTALKFVIPVENR